MVAVSSSEYSTGGLAALRRFALAAIRTHFAPGGRIPSS
jgi:hypothetical protein